MPQGIIPELTVEHWFEQNDVYNHPNGHDVFNVINRDRFITIPEGIPPGNHLSDYTDGDILLRLHTEIMKYTCTPIFPEELVLQKHWLYSLSLPHLNYPKTFLYQPSLKWLEMVSLIY